MIANMRRGDLDSRGAVSNSGLVCRIPSHKPGSIDMASVGSTINYSIFQASSGLGVCSQDELMMVKSTCRSCSQQTLSMSMLSTTGTKQLLGL